MGTTAAGVMTMCIIAEIKLSTSTYNNFYLKEGPNVPKNVIGIRNTTNICVAWNIYCQFWWLLDFTVQ